MSFSYLESPMRSPLGQVSLFGPMAAVNGPLARLRAATLARIGGKPAVQNRPAARKTAPYAMSTREARAIVAKLKARTADLDNRLRAEALKKLPPYAMSAAEARDITDALERRRARRNRS